MPLSVPTKYFEELSKAHGDPFVWWAGQILAYLMRYNEKFEKTVGEKTAKLKFVTPCVGLVATTKIIYMFFESKNSHI